jgi:hypothetical protein
MEAPDKDSSKLSEHSTNNDDDDVTLSTRASNELGQLEENVNTMNKSRILVLVLLAVIAAIAGALTFVFKSREEDEYFENQVSFAYSFSFIRRY